jgi:outer membrane protein OmpA-like peptidoglycan-associated protein
MRRRRRTAGHGDAALFSPLLDVLMNVLGAILVLLVVYVFLNKDSSPPPVPPPIPDPPPVIILSEDDPVYRFESGSARIREPFRKAFLAEVLPRIEELSRRHECDVIEVVGHTDGQPVQTASNLDLAFIDALRTGDLERLTAGSNFDLGAMRALSVVALLKNSKQQGRLAGVGWFYPYSSGQGVLLDQTSPTYDDRNADPGRRRIEIRLRRSVTLRFERAPNSTDDPVREPEGAQGAAQGRDSAGQSTSQLVRNQ